MATLITMQDAISGEVVDDDYDDVLASMQSAAQNGRGFLALDGREGERMAFYIPNILSIKELSEWSS